ncbi:MAG: hypothetical protein LBU23_00875 [Planctomycetota bacterium]|jgi:magnesium transporter|nr:hypothetical protein [Planctomycetota bacterium]
MITMYRLDENGKAAALANAGPGIEIDSRTFWLDSLNPGADELERLRGIMGIDIPDKQDMAEIELSNRLYKDGDALIMIASLIPKSAGRMPPPHPATFIFTKDLLLTVRFCEFFSFERMAAETPRDPQIASASAVFFRLLEEMVSDRADGLESSMRRLEELTARLFMEPLPDRGLTSNSEELAAVLRGIGDLGVEVSIIRESIASLQRVLNFARAHLPDDRKGGMTGVMDSLKNDLTALSDEAAFFMSKLSFNLDATLGLINIDETRVIRLLSIVTLVLSPPLLIAGIYGMNFQNMPELAWDWGYFAALALMALASIAGVWHLRRRKWL